MRIDKGMHKPNPEYYRIYGHFHTMPGYSKIENSSWWEPQRESILLKLKIVYEKGDELSFSNSNFYVKLVPNNTPNQLRVKLAFRVLQY
jgi:hypothetical protein